MHKFTQNNIQTTAAATGRWRHDECGAFLQTHGEHGRLAGRSAPTAPSKHIIITVLHAVEEPKSSRWAIGRADFFVFFKIKN